MEESPINDPSKAGKTEQQGAQDNAPKSGERPDQGTAPTNDHYRPDPQGERDQRHIPAPDVAGAKYRHPAHRGANRAAPRKAYENSGRRAGRDEVDGV